MSYSTQYVADRSGATTRQLNLWIKRGWLNPVENGGSGTQREWDVKELNVAVLMSRMMRAGLMVERAAKVARLVIDNPKPDMAKRNVKLGEGVWIVMEEQ